MDLLGALPPANFIIRMSIGGNYAVVTQLGECKTEDLEVAGSSPAHGTMISPIPSNRRFPFGA